MVSWTEFWQIIGVIILCTILVGALVYIFADLVPKEIKRRKEAAGVMWRKEINGK